MQVFVNNSREELEAKYVFPLDGSAAVCGFEAFINGKHVIGKVSLMHCTINQYILYQYNHI